jgi:hypothetical protein
MVNKIDEKRNLIYEMDADFNFFLDRYQKQCKVSKKDKPSPAEEYSRHKKLAEMEKREDDLLFYLAFSVRDALASVTNLLDLAKENIGFALLTTEYLDRIKELFPDHAHDLPK